jgi:hypothetical protein
MSSLFNQFTPTRERCYEAGMQIDYSTNCAGRLFPAQTGVSMPHVTVRILSAKKLSVPTIACSQMAKRYRRIKPHD